MQIKLLLGIITAITFIVYRVSKRYQHVNKKSTRPYVGVMEDAPGKNFLLVVGILTLVFAPIGIIGLFWLSELGVMLGVNVGTELGIAILHAIFRIVVLGILGIALRKNLQYASGLFFLGVLSIIATFVIAAWDFANAVEIVGATELITGMVVVNLGLGLIFPILFTVGAGKNMDAYDAAIEFATETTEWAESEMQSEHIRPTLTFGEWKLCSNCGVHNVEGGKFCSSCGTLLTATQPKAETTPSAFCNQCGWKNENKLKFCGECGHKLVVAELKSNRLLLLS